VDGVTMALKRTRLHIRMTYEFEGRLIAIEELKRRYGQACWPVMATPTTPGTQGYWTMPIADIDEVATALDQELPAFARCLRRKSFQHQRRLVKRWKRQDTTGRERRDHRTRQQSHKKDRKARRRREEVEKAAEAWTPPLPIRRPGRRSPTSEKSAARG